MSNELEDFLKNTNSKIDTIEESVELINYLGETIGGKGLIISDRNHISGACFEIVIEHHRAIIILINEKTIGSAFALSRCVFESCVRGVWLWKCASDDEIKVFKKNDRIKEIKLLIEDIEKLPNYDIPYFSDMKKLYWSALCSYAHTGMRQIERRFGKGDIGPNYTEEEIKGIMINVNNLGTFAALQILQIALKKP
jgi:hypothetical protein